MFDIFATALQSYCSENNLDFNKVIASPKCGNKMALFIQHLETAGDGLKNDIPAEILLAARKDENGNIIIEEYEGAAKYLRT